MSDAAVSPFVAAFLAADQIAKPGGTLNSVHAPVGDVKVNLGDMCAKMFAYEFLCLWDDGAIEISLGKHKVLFVTTNQASIKKNRDTTQVTGGAPLLAAIRDGKSAHDAVYAWFGKNSLTPWQNVAQSAFKEAAAAGLLTSESGGVGGAIGAALTGLPKMHPVAEKQAEIVAIASSCAARWKRFESEQADLAQQLVKECYSAIDGRVDRSAMVDNMNLPS